MVTVALIASIVSICLAFFAIWQANHHRDQSDKLNRDTTEKLVRIETFASSIKEDAFAETKRWGDFARAGGKALEEAEKAKEEEMRKLKNEIQAATAEEITRVFQEVERKLADSTQTSTIGEIRKEFSELKEQIEEIQDKGVAATVKRTEQYTSVWALLPLLNEKERSILRSIAEKGEASYRQLVDLGHDGSYIDNAIYKAQLFGLIMKDVTYHRDEAKTVFRVPDSLKGVLVT